jgi:hypothetical protein
MIKKYFIQDQDLAAFVFWKFQWVQDVCYLLRIGDVMIHQARVIMNEEFMSWMPQRSFLDVRYVRYMHRLALAVTTTSIMVTDRFTTQMWKSTITSDKPPSR